MHRSSSLAALLLLASLVVVATAIPACTDADKRYIFTECNHTTNKKQSIEYFARECTPSAEVSLREPMYAPCIKACQSGEFYSAAQVECKKCPVGSFSNSGGLAITDFRDLPDSVTTYCHPKPCQMWQASPSGKIMDSGNQSVGVRVTQTKWWSGADETVDSTLELIVNVVNTIRLGKLMFKYRVESERYFDGLLIKLNGTAQKNPHGEEDSRFYESGVHHQWRDATIALPLGRTSITLTFHKDTNQESAFGTNVGTDRAYIRDLVVEGVQWYASDCTSCSAGTYADAEGSMHCNPCQKDFYSEAGARECTACPQGSWAPPGSSKCIRRVPCAEEDYVAVYTDCNLDTRKRRRTWKLTNLRCDVEKGIEKTDDEEVACADCMPGFIRNAKSFTCEKCPAGQHRTGEGTCTACSAGTAAVPTMSWMNGFDSFGGSLNTEFFTSQCEGSCDCRSGGSWCTVPDAFEVASFPISTPDGKAATTVGIRSSLTYGSYYTADLTYKFKAYSDGHVEIRFFYYRPYATANAAAMNEDVSALVSVDGFAAVKLDPYYDSVHQVGNARFPFKAGHGDHEFKLEFAVQGSANDAVSPSAIVILGMEVVGDTRGSTGECLQCKAGHYCPEAADKFIPCEPGSYSYKQGASKCTQCDPGFVAKDSGSHRCYRCSIGSAASPDGQLCLNTCNISHNGNHFDLTPLKNVVYGPIFTDPLPPHPNMTAVMEEYDAEGKYRFYVSPCSFINDNDDDRYCNIRWGDTVERAFACQRINANRSYSIGDRVQYLFDGDNRLSMLIQGGDVCHHENRARTTNITFACDVDGTASNDSPNGRLEMISEEPRCQYNFLLTSQYGCSSCTVNSFDRVEGECEDKPDSSQMFNTSRLISYYRKPSALNCRGGYVPPQSKRVTCNKCVAESYKEFWGDCVNGKQERAWILDPKWEGCVDDGKSKTFDQKAKKTRSCNTIRAEVGANPFTGAIAFIIFLLSMLIALVIVLHFRHKRLSVAYARLSSTTTGAEMTDVVPSADVEYDDDDIEKHNEPAAATTPPARSEA